MSDRKTMVDDSCNLEFEKVYKDVKITLEEARSKAYSSVNFYIDECIKSNWSTRQLERQIN